MDSGGEATGQNLSEQDRPFLLGQNPCGILRVRETGVLTHAQGGCGLRLGGVKGQHRWGEGGVGSVGAAAYSEDRRGNGELKEESFL